MNTWPDGTGMSPADRQADRQAIREQVARKLIFGLGTVQSNGRITLNRQRLVDAIASILAATEAAVLDEAYQQVEDVAKRDEKMMAKFEHLLEYWNGDENERAMADALHHILDEIQILLAELKEPT